MKAALMGLVILASLVSFVQDSLAGDAVAYFKDRENDDVMLRLQDVRLLSKDGAKLDEFSFEAEDGIRVGIPFSKIQGIAPRGPKLEIRLPSGRVYMTSPGSGEAFRFVGANEFGGETSFDTSRLLSVQFKQ